MKQSYKQTSTSKNQPNTDVLAIDQVFTADLKNAVLMVSLLINLSILIGYMVVQTTSAYDHQVISFLLVG